MLAKLIREYFSFTRKERVAVLILVFLVAIIFLLPYILPKNKKALSQEDVQKFRSAAASLKFADKSLTYTEKETSSDSLLMEDGPAWPAKTNSEAEANITPERFYFDPNTLEENGWKKLGLQEKTIRTIQNYLSKGGRFRFPEDIDKIYGLRKPEAERLKPLIRIKTFPTDFHQKKFRYSGTPMNYPTVYRPKVEKSLVDVNLSDTTSLIALPGIGSRLATRIINFREKLGGFYSVQQLAEVYGLPDSTFQTILPRLTISEVSLKTIDINHADLSGLQEHPYLRGAVARAIDAYRHEHGNFKNPDELLQIQLITPALLQKLKPYLRLGNP